MADTCFPPGPFPKFLLGYGKCSQKQNTGLTKAKHFARAQRGFQVGLVPMKTNWFPLLLQGGAGTSKCIIFRRMADWPKEFLKSWLKKLTTELAPRGPSPESKPDRGREWCLYNRFFPKYKKFPDTAGGMEKGEESHGRDWLAAKMPQVGDAVRTH